MQPAAPISPKRRFTKQQIVLLTILVIAILIAIFFGFRLTRRIINRPSREPIQAWMSITYIARAHNIPSYALFVALNIQSDEPSTPQARRIAGQTPISEWARQLNKSTDEVIKIIETRIAQGPPYPNPPPPSKPNSPPPPNK
jgi:hypothetical protein